MSTDEDQFPDPATGRGYELTGKIMMCAIIIVFAVVVVMVLLHIYARWYILRSHRRRRRRRTHLVFYSEPVNSNVGSGLDAEILKSIPTFVFSSANEEEKVVECAVCLSEFEDGEKGRLLPKCNHGFHVDCIDMWFHSHSTCPLCRTVVDGEISSPVKETNENIQVVVELSESTQSESGTNSGFCSDCGPGPSNSSSFGARRKGLDLVGVTVEVPARTSSFRFLSSDEIGLSSPAGQGFKSPTSRLLSLKRILSREKKPVTSPGSSTSVGTGTSCGELADVEEGRVETRTSRSRATTPR